MVKKTQFSTWEKRLLLPFLALLSLTSLCATSHAETVVVVSTTSPVEKVTSSELRRIYLGKILVFPNTDEQVVPIDTVDESDLMEGFYDQVLRKSLRKIDSYWARKFFTGKGRPPRKVKDTQALKELVAGSDIHIGYIPREDLDERLKVIYRLKD